MSEDQLRRDIQDLKSGRIETVGTVSLTVSPATSTSVTRRIVSATSHIALVPTNSAASLTTYYLTPAKGSFVITHPASTSTRTFTYAVFTGNT